MVFASLTFLYLFLPLNVILYFALPRTDFRNWLLVFFSLAFYAWGEPVWVSLLVLSATVDFGQALLIERFRGRWPATAALVSSLVINLSLLATFKYAGFLVRVLNDLLSTAFEAPRFSLPIGISFYTFQTVSYVVDVYRGQVAAQRSYMRFLLFVSLFHQLVAGPIVRYSTIGGEIDSRTHSLADFSAGLTRFSVGLFKKVCIANVAGELVRRYMDWDPSSLSVGEGWFGLSMFSLQIYYDFSGYSDMAIGLGRMFGFHYLENFDHPYVARSASEFWRRWHISLQTFFRDYVYLPMGGRLRRPWLNLVVVWFLTGLWHGPSWNFVLWGLYFALLLAVERLFLDRLLSRLPAAAGHAYLVLAVVLGWALFYFVDLDRLGAFLRVLFGLTGAPLVGPELPSVLGEHALWLGLAVAFCLPLRGAVARRVEAVVARRPAVRPFASVGLASMNVGLVLVSTAMLVGGTYNPFLYYRF